MQDENQDPIIHPDAQDSIFAIDLPWGWIAIVAAAGLTVAGVAYFL